MRCPHCQKDNNRVVESRSAHGGKWTRRRRVCDSCGKRFTTYETWDKDPDVALAYSNSWAGRHIKTAISMAIASLETLYHSLPSHWADDYEQ